MSYKLYVGNLGYEVTSDQLREMFSPYGIVQSARVVTERESTQSKGFGFVEMESEQEAQAAIAGMSGQIAEGRMLKVSKANPKVNLTTEPGGGRRGGLGGTRD